MWYENASNLEIAARIIIPAFFLFVGLTNLTQERIEDHVKRLGIFGAPMPKVAFFAGTALNVISSLVVLSGWNSVYGVYGLMLFLVLSSALLLRFWEAEGPPRNGMRNGLLSNTAIFGGLLLLLQSVQSGG